MDERVIGSGLDREAEYVRQYVAHNGVAGTEFYWRARDGDPNAVEELARYLGVSKPAVLLFFIRQKRHEDVSHAWH